MKTSFVFVSQEIRKQKLHKKYNRVNKSYAFRNFHTYEHAHNIDLCLVDFVHVNASFSWFSHIPFGEFFLNFAQLSNMIMIFLGDLLRSVAKTAQFLVMLCKYFYVHKP